MVSNLPAGPYFLDTSALVKAYILEEGSEAMDMLLQSGKPILVSSMGVLETMSAFQRLHAVERTLGPSEFHGLCGRLLTDISDGLISVLNPGPYDFEAALSGISNTFLTAMDALHIGMARNTSGAVLVSSDDKLNSIARENGLRVFDPTKT